MKKAASPSMDSLKAAYLFNDLLDLLRPNWEGNPKELIYGTTAIMIAEGFAKKHKKHIKVIRVDDASVSGSCIFQFKTKSKLIDKDAFIFIPQHGYANAFWANGKDFAK
jgi:hypothetical protein